MDVGDRVARARELRDRGLSYRQIADEVGVAASTVRRDLNPEQARANLERNRRRRMDADRPRRPMPPKRKRGQELPWEGVE